MFRACYRLQTETLALHRPCAILQKLRRNFIFPRLIIRSSDIHAAGCFALEPIAKGTRLLEYEGERITKEEGDLRYEGRPFTYLFGIGKVGIYGSNEGLENTPNSPEGCLLPPPKPTVT